MENKVPSRHYLGYHSKDFPETPNLSLQLYCLETKSVCLASAINTLNAELNSICHLLALLGAHHFLHVRKIRVNKWQVFYVTYIHERGTKLRCYSFLFISIRLQACCVIHLYSCSYSMHDLRFKSVCVYFISHTFI